MMKPLTPAAIQAERNNNVEQNHDYFFEGLNDFLQALKDWQVNLGDDGVLTGIPVRDGVPCGKCNLTFYFYYSRGGGYRNAIWIKVDNIHNIDVWIRVGFSHTGNKNANIWSRYELDCDGIIMYYCRAFALPFEFNNPGIYKTNERVHPCSWNDILIEICHLIPCACNAHCK